MCRRWPSRHADGTCPSRRRPHGSTCCIRDPGGSRRRTSRTPRGGARASCRRARPATRAPRSPTGHRPDTIHASPSAGRSAGCVPRTSDHSRCHRPPEGLTAPSSRWAGAVRRHPRSCSFRLPRCSTSLHTQASMKRASWALRWMNRRRGSTSSPISMEKVSSAWAASSMWICFRMRCSGSMVVSHSSW